MTTFSKFIGGLLLTCMAANAHAQKNLVPASQSSLAGITLPTNSKLDNRLLMRAAAKTTLDMEAKDSGLLLGDLYEVYMMPAMSQQALADSISTALGAKGWRMPAFSGSNWRLAYRGQQQAMVYIMGGKKESTLYLAEVKGEAPAKAPPPPSNTTPQPAAINTNTAGSTNATTKPAASAGSGKYAFTTTTFDDGWVANDKPDWIELTKGNLTVLLHHYNAAIDMSSGQTPLINASAWNTLVAPKYADKQDYYAFNGNTSYIRSSATSAFMTDQQGRQHYVVLFRRGGGLFMEFISPDRASFEKEFSMNISEANNANLVWSDDALWLKMDNMQNRNRFAVALQDLPGSWVESSGAATQLYYVNSGNYAGMNAVSTSAEFWLQTNGSYQSQHKGASGMVGNQSFFQQEYKGKYSMNGNWELSMTNRYQGKTEIFNGYFEVVKGGRILHLSDKSAPGVQYHLARVK